MVQDEDYWDTLDHISGHYLTVFSFHLPSKRKNRLHQSNEPLPDTNKFFERQFGFSLNGSRPRLLFFQVDGKDTEPYFYDLWGDSVVNTDSQRQTRVLDCLQTASDKLQILILTCHPERYRGVGGVIEITERESPGD